MLPLFDSRDYLHLNMKNVVLPEGADLDDFTYSLNFLRAYKGSLGTFNGYRREVGRLLLWTWTIRKKSLPELIRDDIESFMSFCINPPKELIGIKKVPRFIFVDDKRIPNPQWKPFVVTVKKAKRYLMARQGLKPTVDDYSISNSSVKESFAILSTFFNYLLSEQYVTCNPVVMIRQKSKYFRKYQTTPLKRLSHLQWQAILKAVDEIQNKSVLWKERTRFILSLLFGMYLRISEITATERWEPCMNCFSKDGDGNWWFTTVGKGNKERKIAVSDAVLESLKRWRSFLGLPSLPTPVDDSPLIVRLKGKGSMCDTVSIRRILQKCFDKAADILRNSHPEESDGLRTVTVHWLRHTGISEDVKVRPINHVRDDAGHESIATTNRYINTLNYERHESARTKSLHFNYLSPFSVDNVVDNNFSSIS